METLLIVATYPIENQKDGMLQRIVAVDREFSKYNRIYLEIGRRKYFRSQSVDLDDGMIKIIRLNLVIHFFKIKSLLAKYKHVYIHSVLNSNNIFLFSLRSNIVTLDFHGCVPEEMAFSGRKRDALLFSLLEEKIVSKCSHYVCVSNAMKEYYLNKYPRVIKESSIIVKPIYSPNVFGKLGEADSFSEDELRRKLHIGNDDTVFIYSGNLQAWQNVDMMLDHIKRNFCDNYFYIFLTGEKEKFQKLIEDHMMVGVRYLIQSVSPDQIKKYYMISHYGYILRDDHVLNQIASPTKLTEYLYYGITPIVKYEKIGDAYLYGYDYIVVSDNLPYLAPRKNKKNIEVAGLMAQDYSKGDIRSCVSDNSR